jgi:hypothetical protein
MLYVALAVGWALSSHAEVAPAPRLWLSFDGNYADSGTSTYIHTITPNGSPVFTDDVPNATLGTNSIYLAGSSSVQVGNSPDIRFNVTNAFSVSSWIRTTNYGTVWAYSSSVGISSATTTLCCWVDNGDNDLPGSVGLNVFYGSANVFSTKPVNDGAWHNVILTFDPHAGWTLYLDGVSNAATTGISAADEGANSDEGYWNLTIGNTLNTDYPTVTGPGNPYTGKIDQVAYWDKVLTPNQVASIYSTGIPTNTIDITTEPMETSPVYFGGVTNAPFAVPTNLTLSVTGTPVGIVGSIGYQWQSNGVDIAGATTSTYTTPAFGTNTEYSYQCFLTVSSVTVGSSIVNVYPVVVSPPTLPALLWLGFNNNLQDSGYSTNNHLATFVGSGAAYTNDVANPSNGTASLFLTGNGSYVSDTNTEDVNLDQNFTLSAWIRTTNPGVIWSKSSVSPLSSQALVCFVRTNGVIQVNRDTPSNVRITGTRVVTDGQWHHVVITAPTWNGQYLGTALYVDGYVDVVNENPSVCSGSGASNMLFTVGATLYASDPIETGVSGEPFNGEIDEVEYWPAILSAGQVGSVYLFNSPRAGIIVTQQPTNVTANDGQTATFKVAGTLFGASGIIDYQWASNGVSIVGATSATYTTPPLTGSADGSSYSCQLTSGDFSASSANALLSVVAPPRVLPLLWLPFNGNYADLGASNSFHVITLVGNPVFTNDVQTNANSGTASLYLSGNGSYIDVPKSRDLNYANPYTVTAWIKTTTNGVITAKSTTNVVAMYPDSFTFTEAFYVQDNGNLVDNIFYGSWLDYPPVSPSVVNNDQWTFVAETSDGTSATNGFELYINGQPVVAGGTQYLPNEGANGEGPWDFTVGATLNPQWPNENGVLGEPFTGSINQVTFWNTDLGAGAINYIYQYGVGRPVLSVSKSGGNAVLSWAMPGYKLQQNSTLTNPGGWIDVAGGGTSPVTVASGAGIQFFRLVPQ